jgi:hypothetical protein
MRGGRCNMETDEQRRERLQANRAQTTESAKEWLKVLFLLPPKPGWLSEDDVRCVARTYELLDKAMPLL